jgi:hypothetical protein
VRWNCGILPAGRIINTGGKMNARLLRVTILLLTAAGICMAEESAIRKSKDFSIRLSAGSTPGYDEAEASGDSISLDDDMGTRIELLAVRRFFGSGESTLGGMLGGGLFFAGHSGQFELEDEIESSVFGAMMQGGLAVRAGQRVVFELGPYLGLGVANNEITGFGDGTGPYVLLGLKGGVFVLLGNSVELGLEVGAEGISTEQEITDGFDTEDVTFSGSGVHVAAVLAIPF